MTLLRLILIAIVFFVLLRCGLNPFWAILVMLCWRSVLKICLLGGGLLWFAHTLMH